MRAVSIESFGGPEVLAVRDVPAPLVGPDTVLVDVRAAGVNPVDVGIREGGLRERFPTHLPLVLGWDLAGVVAAVGPAVHGFAVGDEVWGYARKDHVQHGTFAEQVAVSERHVAAKPASLSFPEAAAVPLAGLTALQSLDLAGVGAGDVVLVHAAAGGVGSFAVQLAVARGARVIGTASEDNHDALRALGAEPVDYSGGLVERVRALAAGGVDAVLDYHGGEALEQSPQVVKDPARVVSVVDPGTVMGLGGRYCFVTPSPQGLDELARLVGDGSLVVHVAREYPLEDVADAMLAVAGGHTRGKVVLTL